ncbi:MAG: sialidase family protein [Promethearchaeota archaeon]
MQKERVFGVGTLENAPSSHCSSILELPSGDLLVAWFAGSHEKAKDVAIWGSTLKGRAGGSNYGTSGWTRPRVLANTPRHSEGNPVLYLDPAGNVHLFFQTMHHGRVVGAGWSVCTIKHQVSTDEGESWSTPKFLRKMWFWVVRCKPLRLPSGRVVLPVHREMFQYQAMFYVNDDPLLGGKWRRVGRLKAPGGCLEPSIARLESGKLLCSLRTSSAKRVYFSESTDDGVTWTRPTPSPIPNPNSQTDLLALANGHVLLACNPVESGRGELSFFRSLDEGRTWNPDDKFVVEKNPGREYSYPCLIQTRDGNIHATYTHERETINHLEFTEEEAFD